MRDLVDIFSDKGYELSHIQLNELFLSMGAGRKFDKRRFIKWVGKNFPFIMRKGRADVVNLSPVNTVTLEKVKANNGKDVSRNDSSLIKSQGSKLQPLQPLTYFKK